MRSAAPLDRDDHPCRPRHFKPTLKAPCATDAPATRSLDLSHKRLVSVGMVFVLAFLVISLRLADVTLLHEPDANVLRLEQQPVVQPVSYGRADIIDRNGDVIATTLQSPSLFANPRLIADKAGTARQLVRFLPGIPVGELQARLAADKGFVWLARHLTPGQEYAITALGIPGLDFEHEERRVYPAGPLAAHVAGYTDLDNKGLAGVERAFDGALATSHEPVRLSIDLRLQAILKEEMQKQIDDYNGVGASGIVMDVKTGEILGLVSLPDFDPNAMREMAIKLGPSKDGNDPRFNRATLGIYEMGSVFKIFNTALGLDDKKLTLASAFDTTPIHYGRFVIHDFEHIPGPASVTTIFMESSNIGSARMVQESGPELQREFLGKLGLLRPAAIELPEIGRPEVPNPWREINAMTIAFGHGLGVSPLQTAIAAGPIVNGGVLRPATLIKHAEGYVPAGVRVVSEDTSEEMRKLMRLVVTEGTGKKPMSRAIWSAARPGRPTRCPRSPMRKRPLMASFIGVFPMNDPHYMVYVTIDEPHGNKKSVRLRDRPAGSPPPAVKRVIARDGATIRRHADRGDPGDPPGDHGRSAGRGQEIAVE